MTLTYTCGGQQGIPAGTPVTISGAMGTAIQTPPQESVTANANGPIGTGVPAPVSETIGLPASTPVVQVNSGGGPVPVFGLTPLTTPAFEPMPLIISFYLPRIRTAPPPRRIATLPAAAGAGTTSKTNVQVLEGADVARGPGAEGLPPIGVRHEIISSGPTQQVERITLTNNMLNRADFGSTVIISSPPGVQASTVEVSTGSAVIQGDQVVWSGFSLDSGGQASVTVTLQASGGGYLVGSGSALIQTVTIEALDSVSGQKVVERATGVDSPPSPGTALPLPVLALLRQRYSRRRSSPG